MPDTTISSRALCQALRSVLLVRARLRFVFGRLDVPGSLENQPFIFDTIPGLSDVFFVVDRFGLDPETATGRFDAEGTRARIGD